MKEQYIAWLKRIKLFQDMSDHEIETIASSFLIEKVEANQYLFKQGDVSDAMYILLEGHLLAILETKTDHVELMGTIKIGEVVGEMGFFSKKPRYLTVKALGKCNVLKISEQDFLKFVTLVPAALYKILENIIFRSQSTIHMVQDKVTKHRSKLILIAAATKHVQLDQVRELLKDSLKKNDVFLIDSAKIKELSQDKDGGLVLDYLESLREVYECVVYFAYDEFEKVNKSLVIAADIIKIVVNGEDDVEYSDYVNNLIYDKSLKNIRNQTIKKELIVKWEPGAIIRNTKKWLDSAEYSMHYHIQYSEDYPRLVRFCLGKPICLVLSGGGMRGWAHVGLIKSMRKLKIPIDVICATSAGSGVGASYIITKTQDEFEKLVTDLTTSVKDSSSWLAMTPPVISFYDGVKVTEQIKHMFKDLLIEDLPIPYFTIACNVNKLVEVVFNKGALWVAVRSSGSLPAILPPVVDNGDLLVDGGLMNNLPTDVVRSYFGDKAVIIASDTGYNREDKKQYTFPPQLSLKEAILYKLGVNKNNYIIPSFFTTLLKSMLIGSYAKYLDTIANADYFLQPPLDAFEVLDYRTSSWEKMIDIGFKYANVNLADFVEKEKLHQKKQGSAKN